MIELWDFALFVLRKAIRSHFWFVTMLQIVGIDMIRVSICLKITAARSSIFVLPVTLVGMSSLFISMAWTASFSVVIMFALWMPMLPTLVLFLERKAILQVHAALLGWLIFVYFCSILIIFGAFNSFWGNGGQLVGRARDFNLMVFVSSAFVTDFWFTILVFVFGFVLR